MSIISSYLSQARALELVIPETPDRARGSNYYSSFIGRKRDLQARVDRAAPEFLQGRQALAGAAPLTARTDRKGKPVSVERAAESDALLWQWADALARLDNDGVRADGLVPMASQGLSFFFENVYEIQHADLPAWEGKICKIDRKVDRAAEEYVWYEKDLVGVARAINTYDTMHVPMVAAPAAQANRGSIVPWLCGLEMNFMDLRREALAKANNKPDFQIYQSKVASCQRLIAEAIHFQWLYGDAQLGVDGLFNHPAVASLVLPGGAWSSKTALQILDDLQAMAQVIPNASQGQLGDPSKIRILLPPDQFNRASNLPVTAAGSESVLSYFSKTQRVPMDNIVRMYDFAAANSQMWIGGPQGLQSDRAVVIYDQGDEWDPAFVLSQPIEIPMPPRQNLMSETTVFHARAGGLKLPDARRIRFIDGI